MHMKGRLIGAFACCTALRTVSAQDVEGRQGLSETEARNREAVIEEYDINQDGVLDSSEQKKLKRKDRKTLAKTGGIGTSGKASTKSGNNAKKKADPNKHSERDKEKSQHPGSNHEGHDHGAKGNKAAKGTGGKK
jgi:hypothetical protein